MRTDQQIVALEEQFNGAITGKSNLQLEVAREGMEIEI